MTDPPRVTDALERSAIERAPATRPASLDDGGRPESSRAASQAAVGGGGITVATWWLSMYSRTAATFPARVSTAKW